LQSNKSDKGADTSRAIATPGKNGLSLPAVPVLQEKNPGEMPSVTVQQVNEVSGEEVIQPRLADDLIGGKVRIAIAGEHHGDIPDEEEQGTWKEAGIDLHYEEESIPLNDRGGNSVAPDPVILRVAFGFTGITRYVSPFLEKISKPGVIADQKGATDAAWSLDYLLSTLFNDLGKLPPTQVVQAAPTRAMLTALSDLLGESKLTEALNDETKRVILAKKLKKDLAAVGSFVAKLHSESAFSGVALENAPLSSARSKAMLDNINLATRSVNNTIYKVGNSHALDMQQKVNEWLQWPHVTVLNRAEYLPEFADVSSELAAVQAVDPSIAPGISAKPSGATAGGGPPAPKTPVKSTAPGPSSPSGSGSGSGVALGSPVPKTPAKFTAPGPSAPSGSGSGGGIALGSPAPKTSAKFTAPRLSAPSGSGLGGSVALGPPVPKTPAKFTAPGPSTPSGSGSGGGIALGSPVPKTPVKFVAPGPSGPSGVV
jgi:hypothetical protein